jgi:hypothetical protein
LLFSGFGISLLSGCRDLGETSLETLDMTATNVVAPPKPVLDLSAVAIAPADEPAVGRWPGWVRVSILLGGAGALWAGIGWIAVQVVHLS